MESDFKALVATIPIMEKVIKKMKRFVDLCSLSQHVSEVYAVQCSAVQCSAVQCSAVQCSAVQCSAV